MEASPPPEHLLMAGGEEGHCSYCSYRCPSSRLRSGRMAATFPVEVRARRSTASGLWLKWGRSIGCTLGRRCPITACCRVCAAQSPRGRGGTMPLWGTEGGQHASEGQRGWHAVLGGVKGLGESGLGGRLTDVDAMQTRHRWRGRDEVASRKAGGSKQRCTSGGWTGGGVLSQTSGGWTGGGVLSQGQRGGVFRGRKGQRLSR